MVKPKESHSEFCARMVKEFPGTFTTDKKVLFCIHCESSITAEKKSHVKQHISTDKHKKKVEESNRSGSSVRQSLLTEHRPQVDQPQPPTEKLSEYSMDVCKAFIEANIPLKKVSNPAIVNLFQKYTGKPMPNESTLRQKYVPVLYNDTMKTLREKANGKHIWVSIDETTDVEQRYVVNFIFGILDGDENSSERGKCYLLNMAVVENANASTMAAFFNDSLLLLWPNGVYSMRIPHIKIYMFIKCENNFKNFII